MGGRRRRTGSDRKPPQLKRQVTHNQLWRWWLFNFRFEKFNGQEIEVWLTPRAPSRVIISIEWMNEWIQVNSIELEVEMRSAGAGTWGAGLMASTDGYFERTPGELNWNKKVTHPPTYSTHPHPQAPPTRDVLLDSITSYVTKSPSSPSAYSNWFSATANLHKHGRLKMAFKFNGIHFEMKGSDSKNEKMWNFGKGKTDTRKCVSV